MDAKRTIWPIIVIGVLLICCLATVIGGVAGYFLLSRSTSSDALPTVNGPIIVVTRMVTATPTRAVSVPGTPGLTPETLATPVPGQMVTPESNPGGGAPLDSTSGLLQAESPSRDLRDLALRLKPGLSEVPIVVNATPPDYEVGDSAEFWVGNNDTQEHKQITAILRYKTDHVYMWVQRGVRFYQSDIEASADRFESTTYPTNREFFGSEWSPGVDNDVRLTILNAEGLGDTVAGYYSSADEFSHLINPYSNEREMFYVSIESGSSLPNSAYYDGTLAHEFQHMIHWANDRNEDSWVNEGMSELAGALNGFDVGNADVTYSLQPDTQLTTWNDPSSEGNSEHYGASYLFMSYFLDRFGEDLTKGVVASPKNGMAGFNDALEQAGRAERFDDIFADWVIANYVDQTNADTSGRFSYENLDPYPPVLAETYRTYPVQAAAQVRQYGVDYIRMKGDGPVTIDFSGQSTVKLVGAETKGSYSWWSNRGDDSDMTLTRSVDLTAVRSATLNFSIWYDVEDGWDYAYIMASTDSGANWDILPARHTTDDNPAGNAFGVGWTGSSTQSGTSGAGPEWLDESVDLSAYAGQKILLRFEYVTDDAVNLPGLLIDNVSIPEIGFGDDGEQGVAGWDAEGWVLISNSLPETWIVQLIEIGANGITLNRMDVDSSGKGQLTVDDLSGLSEAVLVVSAAAPVTTEPASYSYDIVQR